MNNGKCPMLDFITHCDIITMYALCNVKMMLYLKREMIGYHEKNWYLDKGKSIVLFNILIKTDLIVHPFINTSSTVSMSDIS